MACLKAFGRSDWRGSGPVTPAHRRAGPLTPEGVALVKELDRFGIIQDASHLAEASFWQLLELTTSPVMASHSNCRAFVPTDRHLSDEMIKAIVARDGVIGINYFDKFLLEPKEYIDPPGESQRCRAACSADLRSGG